MDEQRLNEIRARLAARYAWAPGARTVFRVHAPADIAALLAALAAVEAERDALRATLRELLDAGEFRVIEDEAIYRITISAEFAEHISADLATPEELR